MAKSKKSTAKATKTSKRSRRERRFEPESSANPSLVKALGAAGGVILGAGAYGQLAPSLREGGPISWAPWLLAAGAVATAVSVWIGTSADGAVRVGDAGIAIEKRGVLRMPWHAVKRIALKGAALEISGTNDAGDPLELSVSTRSHPQATAWIVREARRRIPSLVEVPEDASLAEAREDTGRAIALEAIQVVGKVCAAGGKPITYEPDARICPRCERIYFKDDVPDACACGAAKSEIALGS